MSLRHGLLGLLAEAPASGYDLTRRFAEVLGPVWPARHPQIYAELTRLADEGLIEVASRGPRGRTAYRITDAGLAEVRRWLAHTETDHTLRVEGVLRSVFFWLMSPQQLQRHLQREVAFYTEMAARYRRLAEAEDRGEYGDEPPVRSLRLAVEAGIRLYETLADWARWAATRPITAPASTAAPATSADPTEPAAGTGAE